MLSSLAYQNSAAIMLPCQRVAAKSDLEDYVRIMLCRKQRCLLPRFRD